MEINIKLSMEQLNVVLIALSKQPYDAVAAIIGEIQQQAQPQVQAAQASIPQDAELPSKTEH